MVTYPFNLFHCRCYAKIAESFILQSETTHLLVLSYLFDPQSRGSVEDQLARWTFLGLTLISVCLSGGKKKQIIDRNRKNDFPTHFGQSFVVTYPVNCVHCRCYATTTESLILQSETTHLLVLTYPFDPPKPRFGR